MIEKNVTLPVRNSDKKTLDELRKMQPGDSVFIAGAANQKDSRVERIRKFVYRQGWGHAVRQVEGGMRVWRVT
jgi:TusA-related sulfurtransferase